VCVCEREDTDAYSRTPTANDRILLSVCKRECVCACVCVCVCMCVSLLFCRSIRMRTRTLATDLRIPSLAHTHIISLSHTLSLSISQSGSKDRVCTLSDLLATSQRQSVSHSLV